MKRGWTMAQLCEAQTFARAGLGLSEIADETGRFAAEVDIALWALVGRSPEQALARLNAEATQPAPAPSKRPFSAILRLFLKENLG